MKTAEREPRGLTHLQKKFVEHVAAGASHAGAYTAAVGGKGNLSEKELHNRAYRMSKRPAVASRLKELAKQSDVKILLSLNDRLGILAKIAQGKTKPNEKTRAIDVYSKIAGDGRGEVLNVKAEISGPEGGPIAVAGSISVRDKIAKFRAAREGRSS